MHTFKNIFTPKVVLELTVVTAIVIAIVAMTMFSRPTQAQTTGPNVHGYAWSSTIGWISLNCAEGSPTGTSNCATVNYGVSKDPVTGAFSGYAWSSNIGWIAFDSSCGPVATLTGTTVTGWARVVNGTPASGADGCISFSGTSPTYGVTYNPTTNQLSGYAWGSTNVGWVDFSYATIDVPPLLTALVDIKANGADSLPLTTSAGGPITLSWTSSNVGPTCTATAAWSGAQPSTSTGLTVIVPANPSTTTVANHVYIITCTAVPGAAPASPTDQVTVTVPPLDSTGTPSLTFLAEGSVSPSVDANTPIDFSWTTNMMGSCSITSSGIYPGWSGGASKASSDGPHAGTLTSGISTNSIFTMTCTPTAGGTPISRIVNITVNPITCAVTPGSDSDSLPSGAISGTLASPATFGVTWFGIGSSSTIPSTLFNVTPSTTSGTSNSIIPDPTYGNPITNSAGRVRVGLSGTMPTTPIALTVRATSSAYGGKTCTPSAYTITPTGTTTSGGSTSGRPPWEEF